MSRIILPVTAVACLLLPISACIASPIGDAPPATPPDPQYRNEAQGLQAPKVTGPDSERNSYHFFGSLKIRLEQTGYFGSGKADPNYTFAGSILRFGVRRETHTDDFMLELAAPGLFGLPQHASAPSPQGALGQGATYFASNGKRAASLFPRQLYERFKSVGGSSTDIRVGRFEFVDGAENRVTDASLAYLKQNRIANRLISPNPFSYIGRSFDGAEVKSRTPHFLLTALAAMPTRGGYDLSGADTLTKVKVAYLSGTLSRDNKPERTASDSRLFAVFYEDARGLSAPKVDNRPASGRAVDAGSIDIGTLGLHDVRLFPAGGGRVDTLVWGAAQAGKWGALTHGAFAYDLEAGYQPGHGRLHPWYRMGYYYGSGDGNVSNHQHGTFYAMLPSGRTYARFPFFSTSNLKDGFVETVLRPSSKSIIRADIHALGLASNKDLYYTGSGVYDDSAFGITGRPASSKGASLATLYDASLDYQLNSTTLFIAYAGFAHGGATLKSIYSNSDALFTYFEIQKRF